MTMTSFSSFFIGDLGLNVRGLKPGFDFDPGVDFVPGVEVILGGCLCVKMTFGVDLRFGFGLELISSTRHTSTLAFARRNTSIHS